MIIRHQQTLLFALNINGRRVQITPITLARGRIEIPPTLTVDQLSIEAIAFVQLFDTIINHNFGPSPRIWACAVFNLVWFKLISQKGVLAFQIINLGVQLDKLILLLLEYANIRILYYISQVPSAVGENPLRLVLIQLKFIFDIVYVFVDLRELGFFFVESLDQVAWILVLDLHLEVVQLGNVPLEGRAW